MSFHSDTGADFAQAVGDYFERPPVAMAFKDGIMNHRPQLDDNFPGKTMAFQDGSLGALGLPLYVNGEQIDTPLSIQHGGPPPNGGGVLGRGGASNGENSGGGVLGEGGAEGNGGLYPEVAPGPIDAYRDGTVGTPDWQEAMPGALTSYGDGIVGNSSVDASVLSSLRGLRPRRRALRGLGALLGLGSDATVVNLRDPATLREVKQCLSQSVPDEAMTEQGATVYDAAYYASPLWEAKASVLFGIWVQRMVAEGLSAEELATSCGEGCLVPTARAVMAMVAMSIGSPGMPGNPGWFETEYPILSGFAYAVRDAGFDLSGFTVLPPYRTEEEQSAGAQGARLSTMALVGLGVVGALGAAVILHTTLKARKK
jgi:hypothetical protein